MGPVTLSDNTQAVLLLTSPLLAGGEAGVSGAKVLTAGEYSKLAKSLLQTSHQPADLLNGSKETLISSAPPELDPARLNQLLSRGFQLSQAIEHWANRSITVIGRADEAYPKRFKQRLKHQAPPLLYACGNLELLNQPALAVVGSRATNEALLQQTEEIGASAAAAGVVIVSGAARGVDEASMVGALQAGGHAIGVVADSLEKTIAKPIWRQALIERRLLLLSSDAPSAKFQVWRAHGRNKLIYALADAALVMSSAKGSGGTWEGAEEQLTKLKCCPLYVVDDPRGGEGLAALHECGAALWPYPSTPEGLREVITSPASPTHTASELREAVPKLPRFDVVQESLLGPSAVHAEQVAPEVRGAETPDDLTNPGDDSGTVEPHAPEGVTESISVGLSTTPADQLVSLAHKLLLEALSEERTEDELEALLGCTKTQIKAWCKNLASKGLIRKLNKPVRYCKR
jgi:predicted Rossmann fold nucleotide-binding protein DprA/Smf involved in DNA uptake